MSIRVLSAFWLWSLAVVFAAEKAAVAVKTEPMFAGKFSGRWAASEGGANGEFDFTLRRDEKTAWTAEATFTYEGARVPTQVKSVSVEETKLVLIFDWKYEEAAAQSVVTGTLEGETLSGTYETMAGGAKTRGTWRVKRVAPPKKD